MAVRLNCRFEVRYHLVDLAGVFRRDHHIERLAGVQRFEGGCHFGEAECGEILGVGLANSCLPVAYAQPGLGGVAVAAWRPTVGALAAASWVLPKRLRGIGELLAGCHRFGEFACSGVEIGGGKRGFDLIAVKVEVKR